MRRSVVSSRTNEGGSAFDAKPRGMEWWMYVLIAAGCVVIFDVLLIVWLGIATREGGDRPRHVPHEPGR